MDNKKMNIFKEANASFRNNNYKEAIKLYEQAWSIADNVLKKSIEFNHALALKKIDKNNQVEKEVKPEIPVIRFDDTIEGYVEHKTQESIDPAVKLIAFYLPQFHTFPENDQWWGKGFTEWSNVGKALPNYEGHYQPHCPIHCGYYDLRVPSVMEDQAKLAKEYGIYGFSYYYYWFAGKTLMETPLLEMLKNEKIDIPFCLTWANENWTRRWDGQENDILISQDHSSEDSLAFIRNILKYFKDSRYIKIGNKPVLIVYRPNIIPNIIETANIWREEVIRHGFDGVYLISAQTFGIQSPEPFGFDASVEFPPHTVKSTDVRHKLNLSNKDFNGYIFSYDQVVVNSIQYVEPDYKVFRTAMLSWDNTARKQNASHIFHGFTLLKYKQWLSSLCASVYSNKKYKKDEKLVFINAWNEWAEGTHLEPDRKYGYAYLDSTRNVIRNYANEKLKEINNQELQQKNKIAVIVHIHYIDLWSYIKKYLDKFNDIKFDLYISTTNSDIICEIKKDFPDSYVMLVENRGRDVLPFIEMLRLIHNFNYDSICKIHSKRSEYRIDGEKLRNDLYEKLVGSEYQIKNIIKDFEIDSSLGIVVPESFLISHTSQNMIFDEEIVQSLSKIIGIDFAYSNFPAGSMFWFRQSALSRLTLLESHHFPPEEGLADGTTAHGVERLFCASAKSIGYKIKSI